MRNIILNAFQARPEQIEMDDYEKCYYGTYFKNRPFPWDKPFTDDGVVVPQSSRRPLFVDPIAKEIIDSVAADVFGYDKFPTIRIASLQNNHDEDDLLYAYEDDDPESYDEFEELEPKKKKREIKRISTKYLQELVDDVLSQQALSSVFLHAARKALQAGKAIIVFRIVEGKVYFEVINYKYVDEIKFKKNQPDVIESFTEKYSYIEADPNRPGSFRTMWHKRVFNEEYELTYTPAEQIGNDIPRFTYSSKDKIEHEFGFCPAVLMESPEGKSILDGQLENIVNYVHLTNNIYTGIRSNMDPQYVVLEEGTTPTASNAAPKKRNTIWTFKGVKDIKALGPNQNGYDAAMKFRLELRAAIMLACRVVVAPMQNDYQSGKAIQMRIQPAHNAIGEYRVQFGDKALVQLCDLVLKAIVKYNELDYFINVPEDLPMPTNTKWRITLGWGQIQVLTEDEKQKAINNALMAYKGGLMELAEAIRYIAPFMEIPDVEDMIKRLKQKEKELLEMENTRILETIKNYKKTKSVKESTDVSDDL